MTYRMIPGMQQIETAPAAFVQLLLDCPPVQIVEIGGGSGQWTMCLASLAGSRVAIYSFDTRVMLRPFIPQVTWRTVSCWSVEEEIAALIALPGPTLLLCDGGNKVREVNTFARHLKPGDVIASHDYSPTRQEFQEITRHQIWAHCEITDDRIADTLRDCRLTPFHQETMREALWGCWRRTG